MYCPRCETPLSNAEIAMDNSYKDITEDSVISKFKLKGKDEYFLAWTTTPWTLIGNVALAINPKADYVKVENKGKNYILATERMSELVGEHKIVAYFKGVDLEGLEYEPLYEIENDDAKKGWYVIVDEEGVTTTDGTGIVHMAAYGEFDYEMIKKYDLPLIDHIGQDGRLRFGPKKWKGEWFKDLDKKVLDDLEKRDLLYVVKKYTHSYPFCYRCSTPLFYAPLPSWFIDIQKIKNKGVTIVPVILHIGLGTFRPVEVEDLTKHRMDSEYFEISQKTADKVNKALESKKNVFVVGTSTCRALETSTTADGMLKENSGWTDKFIYPPYEFNITKKLITNFHMPESTLLMLASAFAETDLIFKAYKKALKEKYHFLSYGDAMIIV